MITLHLNPGHYHQKLFLYHQSLTLIGSSQDDTIISYDDYSYKMHEDGLLYNTFRTSTVTVFGKNVTFKNLTIVNTSGYGPTIGQAIALSIYGTQFKAINCRILGHQDTLFIGPLPKDLTERYAHFLPSSYLHNNLVITQFQSCYIEGDVDFIFGSGMSLFNHCHIHATREGYICAPSTYKDYIYGMIFYKSTFTTNAPTIIARPWRDYGKV